MRKIDSGRVPLAQNDSSKGERSIHLLREDRCFQRFYTASVNGGSHARSRIRPNFPDEQTFTR